MKKHNSNIFRSNEKDPFGDFGESFASIEVARSDLLGQKEKDLNLFANLILESADIVLDFTQNNLNDLESLYYQVYFDKVKRLKIDRATYEKYLSLYFMAILVRHDVARWNVDKNPFSKNKYNLIIEFNDEFSTTGGFATELYEKENEYGREYLINKISEFLS